MGNERQTIGRLSGSVRPAHAPAKRNSWVTWAFGFLFLLLPGSLVLRTLGVVIDSPWLIDVFSVDEELMNGEYVFSFNFPVIVSGLLLFGAAVAWIWLAFRSTFDGTAWALCFGLFMAVMGFDELIVLHERLERLLGVDWQLLYLPVIVLGAVVWVGLTWRLRHAQGHPSVLLFLGAVLWGVSQVLEFVQWAGGKHEAYDVLVAFEETFESWGSIAFLWAAVVVMLTQKTGQRVAAQPRRAAHG